MKADLKMMLIVAGLSGLSAAAVQLAAVFPAYAGLITAAVCFLAPISNVLRSAVEMKEEKAVKIEVPNVSDR